MIQRPNTSGFSDSLKDLLLMGYKLLPEILIAVVMLIYILSFSKVSILRYRTFNTYAWDLGLFNQAFLTTLKHGKLFFSTVELFMSQTGSIFAIHLSPVLFLLLPFYALYPHPETLLVAQTVILAIAAIPLYLIAKTKLKSKWAAFFLVLAYFLYPPLHGVNWFDFHPQAFIPLFMFITLYYVDKGKLLPSLIFTTLTLSVEETGTSLLMIILGIYLLLHYRKEIKVKTRSESNEKTIYLDISVGTIPSILIILIIFSLIWFLTAQWVKSTFFPINPEFYSNYKASKNWAVLGVDDPIKIPFYVFSHPNKVVQALRYDVFWKFIYIVLLFGSLAFLPLRSGFVLVISVFLIPFLLSNYLPYYMVGHQYAAYVIPLVFMATIDALSTSRNDPDRKAILCLLTTSVIFFSIASPLGPISAYNNISLDYKPLKITREEMKHISLLNEVIESIPPDASVLTQNNIFCHFSNRVNAYTIPSFTLEDPDAWKFIGYARQLIKKVDYIVLDTKKDIYTPSFVTTLIKDDFGLRAYGDGILLFKRGYIGSPIFLLPVHEILDPSKLILNFGHVVQDPTSRSGKALMHSKYDPQGTFWFGPYITLPPGNYTAIFRLKVDELGEGHIITLDVSTNLGITVFASHNVDLVEFERAGEWKEFLLSFSLEKPVKDVEFRGLYTSNLSTIYLDCVEVKRSG